MPTNGSPCASSSAPGASPTNISCGVGIADAEHQIRAQWRQLAPPAIADERAGPAARAPRSLPPSAATTSSAAVGTAAGRRALAAWPWLPRCPVRAGPGTPPEVPERARKARFVRTPLATRRRSSSRVHAIIARHEPPRTTGSVPLVAGPHQRIRGQRRIEIKSVSAPPRRSCPRPRGSSHRSSARRCVFPAPRPDGSIRVEESAPPSRPRTPSRATPPRKHSSSALVMGALDVSPAVTSRLPHAPAARRPRTGGIAFAGNDRQHPRRRRGRESRTGRRQPPAPRATGPGGPHPERPVDELLPRRQEAPIVERARVLEDGQHQEAGVAKLPPREIFQRAQMRRQHARRARRQRLPRGRPAGPERLFGGHRPQQHRAIEGRLVAGRRVDDRRDEAGRRLAQEGPGRLPGRRELLDPGQPLVPRPDPDRRQRRVKVRLGRARPWAERPRCGCPPDAWRATSTAPAERQVAGRLRRAGLEPRVSHGQLRRRR